MTRDASLGLAAQPSTPVAFDVPPGACDCLTHIFGDPGRFPMAPGRTYTPQPASIEEIQALHRALGVDRVVIVQPTVYGTDNACTVDALRALGGRARGVAVIEPPPTRALLDDLDAAGIRGIRINLETVGTTDPAVAHRRFEAAVEAVGDRTGWHVQVYTRPAVIAEIHGLVAASPVPVSFDHFAGIQAAAGLAAPGVDAVLDLLRSGKVWIKLSAPYLASAQAPDFPDVTPIARALVEANRDRLLWGTNWPHPSARPVPGRASTDIAPLRRIDDGHILNLLTAWVPDAEDRHAILVDNPAALYGFPAAARV